MHSGGVEQLVVSFQTTEDALKTEEICRAAGIPGRLIPLLPEINASCGLAWRTDLENQERIEESLHGTLIKAGYTVCKFRY